MDVESARRVAKERQHLVTHDADDLLGRRQAAKNLLVHRPIAHTIDEGLDDLEIDVRLEQRETNLAQRRLDVRLGEAPLTADRLEDVLEACAERVEHHSPRNPGPLPARRAYGPPPATDVIYRRKPLTRKPLS